MWVLENAKTLHFDPADSIDALRALLRRFSVEITSADNRSLSAARTLLVQGQEVFVASLPRDPIGRLVDACAQLHEQGFNVVPHVVARNLRGERDLRQLIEGVVSTAGVTKVLVLGGDRDTPMSELEQGLQVVKSGVLEGAGLRGIYLPAYPEGHGRIDRDTLERARQAKILRAREAGLDVTLVSQFCFEAEPILAWTRRLRRQGVTVPYRVGVAGPASRASLMKFALMCGIGPSLRALQEREGLVRSAALGVTPLAVLQKVAAAQTLEPSLQIEGAHFFTFGSLRQTVDWLSQVGDLPRRSVTGQPVGPQARNVN